MQWAAVTTYRGCTSVPPQNWEPERVMSIACQGHSPFFAASPPTILPAYFFPHWGPPWRDSFRSPKHSQSVRSGAFAAQNHLKYAEKAGNTSDIITTLSTYMFYYCCVASESAVHLFHGTSTRFTACVRLQLDHNASCLTTMMLCDTWLHTWGSSDTMRPVLRTRQAPIIDSFWKWYSWEACQNFGCKSAAITIGLYNT